MNKKKMIAIALVMMTGVAMMPATAQEQNVLQLEKDIELHEKNIQSKEAAIADLETRIGELKAQVKDLESQKKALEKEVKAETKLRKEKFTSRDALVYDQEIVDVLYNPYNKADIEEALKSFEGMETKDVMKKKELIEKYGEYTKNLRDFLEKQKQELAKAKWAYQPSTSDIYKKFEKGLKGTKYWKIYDKREKKESIDYLDRVMDKIMIFKNAGLKSEQDLNAALNMLYAN